MKYGWDLFTETISIAEKLQIKITSLWKQKHEYLIHTRPDKAVEGTVVNRTFKFLYWNYAYSPFKGNYLRNVKWHFIYGVVYVRIATIPFKTLSISPLFCLKTFSINPQVSYQIKKNKVKSQFPPLFLQNKYARNVYREPKSNKSNF